MPDKRFFKKTDAKSLDEIADISACELQAGSDGQAFIDDLAPLNTATQGDVSFFDNVKYKDDLAQTQAKACFIDPDLADLLPEGTIGLFSKSPYKAYALTAQAFYPEENPSESKISPDAHIGENVEIGEGTVVEPFAVIQDGVKIGKNCKIGANSSISHALIGDHVSIYPGARIGQDGFGFAIDPAGHVKVPQLGRVIIEDHVEIGANTTIDRGAGPDTIIGQGTWIDNLVQIAHNVKIGKGCVIVAQVGISGSTVLQDYAVLAGQVGIAGHLTIGTGAKIAAQSGVMRDIPAGEEHMGSPSAPIKQHLRQVAALKRLIQK